VLVLVLVLVLMLMLVQMRMTEEQAGTVLVFRQKSPHEDAFLDPTIAEVETSIHAIQ
jgi:hypothetical protein